LSNVAPRGFARVARLEVGDILTTNDGRPLDDLPSYMAALYLHSADQDLIIDVLRGEKQLSVVVPVQVHHEKIDDLNDLPELQRTFIPKPNIFASDWDDELKPLLRKDSNDPGVVVIAQGAASNGVDRGVQSGGIIRAVNRSPLTSVFQLQATIHQLKAGDPVVLQIERGGQLEFLAFEMD
jgi:S1-C subfamily serine protease